MSVKELTDLIAQAKIEHAADIGGHGYDESTLCFYPERPTLNGPQRAWTREPKFIEALELMLEHEQLNGRL